MDQERVREVLTGANLALSLDIRQKVFDFLQDHIGLTSENFKYEVFSALAIVGEVAEVKPVDSGKPVGCGIPLEMVLRHSGGLSKESLLEVVTRQSNKWREAPIGLKLKIDSVKLAYRIFKKYRTVFEALAGKNCIMQRQSQFNLMAIFWIVFLFLKNSSKGDGNTIEATTILYSLFKLVFGEIVTQLSEEDIAFNFRKQFTECDIPSQESYLTYRDSMILQLQSVHDWRYKGNIELNLQILATDQHYMQRFLDDIANHYDKFKVSLSQHTVDEISFLELDKTLTPQTMARPNQGPENTICTRIKFDESDEEQPSEDIPASVIELPSQSQSMRNESPFAAPRMSGMIQRMQPLSPLRRHSCIATPLTARHQNLSWVNRITSKTYQKEIQEIQNIYKQCTGCEYEIYQKEVMGKIMISIQEFTPSCMDFNKRQRSIIAFFAYFIIKIYQMHREEERRAIFKNNVAFDSILCLAANLFNFAYQSLHSSYQEYCHIFGVTLLEGLLPINWFGLNADMPKNIEGFLYDLQKKILIQEIWEDGLGFQVVTSQKTYRSQALLKRLRKHADERTQQLCESMKIEDKQITKVVNLMRFILEKRQLLLKDNKMDQIIVCAIGSILSINRSRNFSLQEIFNHYNKMLYSLNISRSIFYDQNGRQVDLIYYYNHIFLEQVEEIIANDEQALKVLDTPIRLERKRSIDTGIEMTPLSIKFKQVAIGATGFGGSRKLKRDQEKPTLNYRNHLVSSLKNLNIKEQEHENEGQDIPSPKFGGMHRTISFGDPNQKFKQ